MTAVGVYFALDFRRGDTFVGFSFKTAAFISLPALNVTVARAGMGTSMSGLFGFRPIRAFLIFTVNTPKFRSSALPPLARASEM